MEFTVKFRENKGRMLATRVAEKVKNFLKKIEFKYKKNYSTPYYVCVCVGEKNAEK